MSDKNNKPNNSQKKTELANQITQRGRRIKTLTSRIVSFVLKIFHTISNFFDRILKHNRYTKYLALIIAIIFYTTVYLANTRDNLLDLSKNAKSFANIPVEVNYSDQIYEVAGVPQTVSVTAIGDSSDLLLLSQQTDLSVRVDLSTYDEGVHTVELQPLNFSNRLDVKVDPSKIDVTITKKENRQFSFTHEFINQSKMDETLALGTPVFKESQVYVKAPKEKLDKVAYVKALIDTSGQTKDFTTMSKLVAYDRDGRPLDVQILPSEVEVSVPISRPQKDVKLKVEFTGDLPEGKTVDTYTLDIETATIYGPQNVLDGINTLTINVPLDNITGDKVVPMPVQKPNGVNSVSVQTVEVTIKIKDSDSKK